MQKFIFKDYNEVDYLFEFLIQKTQNVGLNWKSQYNCDNEQHKKFYFSTVYRGFVVLFYCVDDDGLVNISNNVIDVTYYLKEYRDVYAKKNIHPYGLDYAFQYNIARNKFKPNLLFWLIQNQLEKQDNELLEVFKQTFFK